MKRSAHQSCFKVNVPSSGTQEDDSELKLPACSDFSSCNYLSAIVSMSS